MYICYSICNLIGAVVKQVISKSRNSTCKLAIAHGYASFNLCQYLYWYTKSHSLLILAATLKPSMKQGVVTPARATPRDCDPVYGRCWCGLIFYTKNPHNHSGFGHGQFSSAVTQSHKVFGWSCLVSFLDPNNPSMDCFNEAICAGVAWRWKRSLLGLFGSGSDPCWGWKRPVLWLEVICAGVNVVWHWKHSTLGLLG